MTANAKTVSDCFSVLFHGCEDVAALFNCSFISDVRTSLKLKHWNSFAVFKNMPNWCWNSFSVLFQFISPCASGL